MTLAPGTTLGPYEIVSQLGQGGMGVVYEAQDPRLKRRVAIKLLPPDLTRDDTAKQRFLQEAQAASALDHTNICTIYEINETDDGQLYLVMAHYEGETLKERIAKGPLELDDAVDIATQVGQGLAAAHGAGIVHRDIKHANLFLTKSGAVKILDFGLAKLAGSEGVTLISAQEASKKGIARELHDVFSQRLASLALEVGTLAKDCQPTAAHLVPKLDRARTGIETLAGDIHELSRKLHPSLLDDLGLDAALRDLAGWYEQNYEIQINTGGVETQHRLAPEVALCLYRVAQECLTNVAKHANATTVSVELSTDNGELLLSVRDDGRGFDATKRRRGLGLTTMLERVRQCEGALEILSRPGAGAQIQARVPFEELEDEPPSSSNR